MSNFENLYSGHDDNLAYKNTVGELRNAVLIVICDSIELLWEKFRILHLTYISAAEFRNLEEVQNCQIQMNTIKLDIEKIFEFYSSYYDPHKQPQNGNLAIILKDANTILEIVRRHRAP